MKTMNVKELAVWYKITYYVIPPVIIIVSCICMYFEHTLLMRNIWSWIIAVICVPLSLFYARRVLLKELKETMFYGIMVEFKRHLKEELIKEDWSKRLPSIAQIDQMIDGYKMILPSSCKSIWTKNLLEEILKDVQVSNISDNVSLYDIYCSVLIHPDVAEVHELLKEDIEHLRLVNKTRICLQKMPLPDLMKKISESPCFTKTSFDYLILRDQSIGDFDAFCKEVLLFVKSTHLVFQATPEAIQHLIKQDVVQVFQPFVAYLVGTHYEWWGDDEDTRQKVFDWYINQPNKDFDFFLYWPKLTIPEYRIIAQLNTTDIDEIFLKTKKYCFVSTERLAQEAEILIKKDGYLQWEMKHEIAQRKERGAPLDFIQALAGIKE